MSTPLVAVSGTPLERSLLISILPRTHCPMRLVDRWENILPILREGQARVIVTTSRMAAAAPPGFLGECGRVASGVVSLFLLSRLPLESEPAPRWAARQAWVDFPSEADTMAASLSVLDDPAASNDVFRPTGLDRPGYVVAQRTDRLFDQLSMLDHYALLGVAPTAPLPQVARAYERRLMECHPDRVAGLRDLLAREQASVVTRRLNTAFQVLSRPDARRAYDEQQGAVAAPCASPGAMQWDVRTVSARRYLELAIEAQGAGDLSAARYYASLARQSEDALPESVVRRLHHVLASVGEVSR
jgi:hypothetical protein